MKNALPACLLAASGVLCAACDLAPVQADNAAGAPERVYTTGSNIGHRRDAPGTDVTTVDREAAEKQLNIRGTVPLSPGGAH